MFCQPVLLSYILSIGMGLGASSSFPLFELKSSVFEDFFAVFSFSSGIGQCVQNTHA